MTLGAIETNLLPTRAALGQLLPCFRCYLPPKLLNFLKQTRIQ
jgi:hypothetical protein